MISRLWGIPVSIAQSNTAATHPTLPGLWLYRFCGCPQALLILMISHSSGYCCDWSNAGFMYNRMTLHAAYSSHASLWSTQNLHTYSSAGHAAISHACLCCSNTDICCHVCTGICCLYFNNRIGLRVCCILQCCPLVLCMISQSL